MRADEPSDPPPRRDALDCLECPADPLEALAARVLGWPLTAAVSGLCLLMAATWLPGYLTWPWWGDHDHFATVARGWEAGLLPYRDIGCNNFPGQIYLFRALGAVFGWGRTAPFWALDAALLGLFAAALVTWSRRAFGRSLPGLVALAAALGYSFNLDYSQAAQRDGQAPLLALTGLLVLLACPGRLAGRLAAAGLLAAAMLIRPHAVLLAPAFAAALWLERPRTVLAAAGSVAGWGLVVAAVVALGFAPLLAHGLGADILAGLRTTVDGAAYNRASPARVAWELAHELLQPRYSLTLALLAALAWTRPASRRPALIALAALAGVLLYRPLSPLHHAYLAHPLALTWAVSLAVLAAAVLEAGLPRASWRLAAVLLVLGLGLPGWPRFSDPRNWRDFAAWCRGTEPTRGPPGYARNPDVPAAAAYGWDDYRQTLAYLRALPPGVRVANVLSGVPALNGPSGRLPVFPAESLVWLALLRPEHEGRFAEALARADDAVVVWDPDGLPGGVPNRFELLRSAIVQNYEPAARFGPIEVWAPRRGSHSATSDRLARRDDPDPARPVP